MTRFQLDTNATDRRRTRKSTRRSAMALSRALTPCRDFNRDIRWQPLRPQQLRLVVHHHWRHHHPSHHRHPHHEALPLLPHPLLGPLRPFKSSTADPPTQPPLRLRRRLPLRQPLLQPPNPRRPRARLPHHASGRLQHPDPSRSPAMPRDCCS